MNSNMYIDNNPQKCFENAIDLNVFTDDNIGNFMYMHSQDRFDYFKDKLTRCYISVQRQAHYESS